MPSREEEHLVNEFKKDFKKMSEEQQKSLMTAFETIMQPSKDDFVCPRLAGKPPVAGEYYAHTLFVDEEYCESFCFSTGCLYIETCPAYNNTDRVTKQTEEQQDGI